MQSQYYVLFQTWIALSVVRKSLVMDFHFKLNALIEIAVWNDLDDDQRKCLADVVLVWDHLFYFTKIYSELLFTQLVLFFGYFFYVKNEFLIVVHGQVYVHREETHKGQHHLFLQLIEQYFWVNDWKLKFSSSLITFIELLLLFSS